MAPGRGVCQRAPSGSVAQQVLFAFVGRVIIVEHVDRQCFRRTVRGGDVVEAVRELEMTGVVRRKLVCGGAPGVLDARRIPWDASVSSTTFTRLRNVGYSSVNLSALRCWRLSSVTLDLRQPLGRFVHARTLARTVRQFRPSRVAVSS